MTPDLQSRFEAVVRKSLNLKADASLNQAKYGSPPNWDSIRHVELFIILQQKFGVAFSADEIVGIQTFEQLQTAFALKIKA